RPKRPVELRSRVPRARVRHERVIVRVVGRHPHLAVGTGRMESDPILGKAFELRRIDRDRAHVRDDVPREALSELDELLADLPHFGAGLLVAIDTGPAEVPQNDLDEPARHAIEPIELYCGDAVI